MNSLLHLVDVYLVIVLFVLQGFLSLLFMYKLIKEC